MIFCISAITLQNVSARRRARLVADAIYEIEPPPRCNDMPNRGRKGRRPDTREMLISGFPFVIIYRVGQEAVEIARILHTSQQWP